MPDHVVLFDTDIGTDVDDALALAVLLGSPAVQLRGVTTVYGDTVLRARLTARYAALAGRSLVAAAGREHTLSGREVWWAGHEGTLHEDLEREPVSATDAVEVLVSTVLDAPGLVDVIAVGPLTNIAAAIERDARFAASVRHLWVMGGAFETDEPEHNLRSDVAAANRVFGAGIPTTVGSLDATRRVVMREEQLGAIARSGPLGAALERDIHQWWAFWNETWNVPHDPVVVLALTAPELFSFSPWGRVSVIEDGEQEGVSRFEPDPDGTVRYITDLDTAAVAAAIVAGVVAAQA